MPPLDEPEDQQDLDPNAKANKEAEEDNGSTYTPPRSKAPPADSDDAEDDAGDEDGGAGEDDGEPEEVEYEGKVYQLPKPLKDALMRNKDYTHKSQEVSKTRAEVEADKATFAEQKKAYEENVKAERAHINDVAEIHGIDREIAEYKKVDWRTWAQTDAASASAAQVVFNDLLRQRDEKAGKINAKINGDRQKAAQAERDTKAAFERDLPLKIKDWGPEKRAKVKEVATKVYGFDEADFEGVTDVRVMKAFDALRELQDIKAKLKAPPKLVEADPVTPVKKVAQGQARVSAAPSDKDSDAEWERKERVRMKAKGIVRY